MVKLVLLLIFCIGLAIFASQNTVPVHLQFLMWRTQDVSLALVIMLSAAIGAVLAFIASVPMHHRRSRELAAKRRELEDLRSSKPE